MKEVKARKENLITHCSNCVCVYILHALGGKQHIQASYFFTCSVVAHIEQNVCVHTHHTNYPVKHKTNT